MQAVGTAVAGIAPLGQAVARTLALEVRARDVIQEQVVLHVEKASQAILEMLLDRLLAGQEDVHRRIEPVRIHLFGRHTQEVVQRRPRIPRLFDVQLARRLAEPGDRENRRHRRPGNFFPARRNQPLQQLVQLQQPPQPPRHPDVAKVPQPLQRHVLQTHQHRLFLVERIVIVRRIEQRPLRPLPARKVPSQLGPAVLLAPLQLAQVSHHPLPRAAARAIRLDQRPVAVRLAVLPPPVASQKHRRSFPADASGSHGHAQNQARRSSLQRVFAAETPTPLNLRRRKSHNS